MIHILDDQNNDILDVITEKNVAQNKHRRSLEDYLESFEFTALADKEFAEFLTNRNRIIVPSEDEGYIEFIIDEVRKKSGNNGLKVRVLAVASYLELKKASVIEPQTLNEYTPSMAVGFAINETEWRPGRIESNAFRTFNISTHTNPFAFLKTVANEFDLELNFRTETRGGRVVGRYVDLLERVGDWEGREITFGKDLEGIERREDVSNIYTALLCLSPEDEDGNRLETLVEDREALQRWGRPDPITGELKHLIRVYEPQSERLDMTLEELTQYGRTELNKRINAVISYDCDVVDLENVPGMENKKIRFGDTIRIKDEKFNPPLYVEARVFEQQRDIFDNSNKHVKLGDFTEFTEEEVQSIWKSLQAEIRNKIGRAELVEYTYDKITIDDKDEHVFEEGKSFAEAVGIEAKEYAESQDEIVKQHADTVAGEAENNAKTYAEDRSAEALQQALAKSVAQEVYDNKMQEIADDLAERTTIEYVDGQLVDKVNVGDVYTIEDVDNMINNVVSITEYETDIDGIVQTLDSQSTQIGQNVEAIGLKADSSRVDAIEGTVDDHNAQFNVMADQISSKVDSTYVRGAIADIEIGGRNLVIRHDELENTWIGTSGDIKNTARDTATMKEYIPVKPNDILTFTKTDSETNPDGGFWRYRWFDENKEYVARVANSSNSFQWQVPNNTFYVQVSYPRDAFPKLEKGNKATDWTPAPEDVQSEIDSVYDYASSEIDQLAGRIDLKAESSYVDGVESRVTTAEQTIDAIDGRISMVVSEQGTINADVRGAIDGIEIGGRNLVIRHDELENTWIGTSGDIKNTARDTATMKEYIPVKPNDILTFTKTDSETNPDGGFWRYRWFDENKEYVARVANSSNSFQWQVPNNTFYVQVSYPRDAFPKLEKGNKATDWTPAPEDTQAEIDSVYDYASSEIDQLAGRIDLKAESSYVDGVESRVNTAEQTIDAIDGRISMVVSEQGTINAEAIASEISLTSSAIDLISSNINLVGAVNVLSDITGDLGTITAGEIYGAYIEGATIRQQGSQNYIEINNDGIFIKDNEFHQPRISIETLDMEYEGGGYFPSLIRFEKNVGEYNFAIGTNGAGLGTGFVGFLEQGSSNRNFEISNPGGSLYFPSREARFTGDVETSGSIKVGGGTGQWVFTNAVDNTVSGTHLYMRTRSGGEVRATENGTTGNYIPMRAGTFYAQEQSALVRSGNIRVESVNNGYAAFASQNGLVYLQTGGSEVRVTNWLSGSSYKPIRASSFPTGSSINTKTNREELSEYDAIRLLDNAYAHKYHLQSNVDNGIYDKQKIGMFSETVPRELRDENGVDPYSIVSVLWKVAQVQRKELTAMKQRIADLEMVI